MRRFTVALALVIGVVVGVEAAPADVVTQADLKVLLERMAKLEAENKAQAKRIAELEASSRAVAKKVESQAATGCAVAAAAAPVPGEGTTTNETGRIWTTAQGFKYYLADASAHIFEPLSESGLKITPYGYLVFEGVYNTHGVDADIYADNVKNPHSRGYGESTSVFSMQDSILGIQFETPEAQAGWKFIGRAEFDLAGDNANDYAFHWRHLYFDAQHESGWSILFGQTWHMWKMVTPSEIDGAWLENTGHPYRRSPQIRVTKKWDFEDSSFEARVGVVKNGVSMGGDRDGDTVQDNSASPWPLFEAAFVYDHDTGWQDEDADNKRWLFGIGGMYGQDRIRSWQKVSDDKEDYESMMLMFAGSVPFGDFTLTGQIFGGQNLGGVQAGVGQCVAFDPVMGDGKEVQTVGGFIDLNYKISADWSAAIGYGFDHPTFSGGYYAVDKEGGYCDNITHNDRAYIDVFYQVTTNFKLGLEYGRLSTTYADSTAVGGNRGGTGYSDRVQFTAFYDF